MRVITGTARGKKLQTLSGEAVRPTPEMVKEAVFSVIQFDIEGRRMLDLFAGSGQMGIEALSRGAKSAVFTDASADSVAIIKSNLMSTGLSQSAVVVKTDYSPFLIHTKEKFDIAFLDPPYDAGILCDALLKTTAVMSEHGMIFCEHPDRVELPEETGGFAVSKVYRYGKIFITLYRKKQQL